MNEVRLSYDNLNRNGEMNNLKIGKPIVFLDLESTGLNPKRDKVVEITVIKLFPDGSEEVKTVRVNPGIPIPASATEVHGICDSDVAFEPEFAQYAKGLLEFLEGCDLGGYNALRFDIPLLQAEFERVGLSLVLDGRNLLDPMKIFHTKEPRDLQAAYRKYCGKDLENAHTSEADVRAAIAVLDAQISEYPDIGSDPNEVGSFCNSRPPEWVDSNGRLIRTDRGPVLSFGKYRDTLLSDLVISDPGYLEWMLSSDFDSEIKDVIRAVWLGSTSVPNTDGE